MDKPQFWVIGILVVAIGFFALRFTSDDSDDYQSGYVSGVGDLASARSYDGSDTSDHRQGRLGGRPSRHDRGSSAGHPSRFGTSSERAGLGGSHHSGFGKGAETASSGSRARHSGFGGRGGLHPAKGVGRSGSASIANTLGSGRTGSGSKSGDDKRSDRVEQLGSQQAHVDDFFNDDGVVKDPEDGLLLDIANKEDADATADSIEGVEESDDGDWLEIGENAQLTFPNGANEKTGTISMDIVPNWNGADITDNSLLQIREAHQWENRVQMVKNGQFLRFIVTDNTGHEADISYKIDSWESGNAHRVTASWNNGTTTLYVDGKQVGSNTYPGQLQFKKTVPIHAGSDFASGAYNGLDGKAKVKLFNDARTPDDISS